MNYDVNYFIKKFEAIPEELWCCGDFTKGVKHCAGGHCGLTNSSIDSINHNDEIVCLINLLKPQAIHKKPNTMKYCSLFFNTVAHINDGNILEYQQPTPKQRILAALYDIKASEDAVKETQEILNTVTA